MIWLAVLVLTPVKDVFVSWQVAQDVEATAVCPVIPMIHAVVQAPVAKFEFEWQDSQAMPVTGTWAAADNVTSDGTSLKLLPLS